MTFYTPPSNRLSDDPCMDCRLCETRTHMVWGEGPLSADVVLFGEGPGEKEDRYARPFIPWARAGKELTKLVDQNGIFRVDSYLSNIVKCRPPENRDPKPGEIAACKQWRDIELLQLNPRLILAVGRIAAQTLLGADVDMETVHGIPFHVYFQDLDKWFWVMPVYHPGAALRSPTMMLKCQLDFATAGAWLKGKISKSHVADPYENAVTYNVVWDADDLRLILAGSDVCAIDVEWLEDGTPYMIQISTHAGSGYVVYCCVEPVMQVLREYLADPSHLTYIHNMASDLPMYEKEGVYIANPQDTMVMAYLLQSEPQGLKPLAFRHCGMKMQDYSDVLSGAASDKAVAYLQEIVSQTWENPEPILQVKPNGDPHLKQPTNIAKRARNILKDVANKGANAWERWHHIKLEEGREDVEDTIGPMPQGDLADVDPAAAVYYAARDPDATIRVAPVLYERIKALGLENTLATDVAVLPMVTDMMIAGITPDLEHFAELSVRFDAQMDNINVKINNLAGRAVRPGSHQDVAKLLFDDLQLFPIKKRSTNAKVLARLEHEHEIVPLIKSWREYQKLKGTYADKMPKMVAADGRVHPTIRVTRTATGRLSATRPNLLAVPTRTEDGREIRNGFVAAPGHRFLANDYAAIEMRVTAHMSGDPLLTQIFRDGGDLHSITASNIFGVPLDQVDELKHRYPSKRLGFGILYGISPMGLREQLLMAGLSADEWTLDRCQELIDAWFELYHGVRDMMDRIHQQARMRGYVSDMWGRIRYVANVHAADEYLREEGIRQAGNAPIQMGAQGVIKLAMGKLNPIIREIRASGTWIWPLLQIHDDLLFEMEDEALEIVSPVIKSVMENTVKLSVPVLVDQKQGVRWGSMEKIK